jgi:hypothetical protein
LQEYIPDRYGEAFLFGVREDMSFNKDFDEFMRSQKQLIFSSTTPYSTRSYTSKRDIQGMMMKTMGTME